MAFKDRDYLYDPRTASQVGTFTTRVYGWMAIGLAFTASVAFFIYQTGLFLKLMPFWWILSLATFGIAMGFNAGINRFSLGGVIGMFLTYAGFQGLLFGTILPFFAAACGGQVIWLSFATASLIFLMATGYGMFTKTDLTKIGRILMFGLIGLIAASLMFMILSFFIKLTVFDLILSYLGLIIFVGLTCFDAQKIRKMSMQAETNSVVSYKLSMVMAMNMYINVIMIFWYLLRILSSSRR